MKNPQTIVISIDCTKRKDPFLIATWTVTYLLTVYTHTYLHEVVQQLHITILTTFHCQICRVCHQLGKVLRVYDLLRGWFCSVIIPIPRAIQANLLWDWELHTFKENILVITDGSSLSYVLTLWKISSTPYFSSISVGGLSIHGSALEQREEGKSTQNRDDRSMPKLPTNRRLEQKSVYTNQKSLSITRFIQKR